MAQVSMKDANGTGFDFECVEGSHVFFNGAAGEDFYSAWEDLTPDTRKAFLEAWDSLSQLARKVNTELSRKAVIVQ